MTSMQRIGLTPLEHIGKEIVSEGRLIAANGVAAGRGHPTKCVLTCSLARLVALRDALRAEVDKL